MKIFAKIWHQPIDVQVDLINALRLELHRISPFSAEPVDCVQWIKADRVIANDYNPNTVAPPEMKLLEVSITEDGYTQPIVSWMNGDNFEVVDGFHRNRVGRESPTVSARIHGYLPLAVINSDRLDRGDRIASTIRHNRARGKHKITAMSDIVVELKRRNWSTERICRDLGMDEDEVLRLCQITGLADLFTDQEFSASWDAEGPISEEDFAEITDDVSTYGEETEEFRTVNTGKDTRVFHTYENWECYKAGFYATTVEGMSADECKESYREFLSAPKRFADALEHVVSEWKNSCEHYLTNEAMNRIAWLGQAAACYALHIPSSFRGGFGLLTREQQDEANEVALAYLNKWMTANNRPEVTMDQAYPNRQSDIY
jgi:ParB-like chromosome segregation protein Spo0J